MPVITPETVSLLTPHLIDLVRGVFKSRKDKDLKVSSEQQVLEILNKDVLELQEVATKQGAAIAEIAQKIDARFGQLEQELRRQKMISLAAAVVAVVAAGIALVRTM
ncbi:hypothetical protein [Noviherbaspirillum massiliense]|uniref:hypothetical protein n=1 Tax=Noviherbaspirillum massiliense TaxID=1465823 RepID=UPI00035EFB8E|nr:hypothetical protein [Noviherbaspirillum massiliense]